MQELEGRRALVVRGGWEGHCPVDATTDVFIPFLREHGYTVAVHDDLDVYADAAELARTDLILQCYTQGTATDEQVSTLCAAVTAGTGFAGWHGGIVDSFRASPDYLHMTGGQWAAHLAVAVVSQPELVQWRAASVAVETASERTRGVAVADLLTTDDPPAPNCQIAVGVDVDAFTELFFQRIRSLP